LRKGEGTRLQPNLKPRNLGGPDWLEATSREACVWITVVSQKKKRREEKKKKKCHPKNEGHEQGARNIKKKQHKRGKVTKSASKKTGFWRVGGCRTENAGKQKKKKSGATDQEGAGEKTKGKEERQGCP